MSRALPKKKAPAGCLIPFGLFFLAVGLGVTWFSWAKLLSQVKVVRSWTETPCRVTQWKPEIQTGNDVYRIEYQVAYDYEFNGRRHTGRTYDAAKSSSPTLNEFEAEGVGARTGDTVCYVNPASPEESSYLRGSYTAGGFVLGMGLLFAGVGGMIVLAGMLSIIRKFTNRNAGPGQVSKGCAGGILAPIFFGLFAAAGFAVWKLALHNKPDFKALGARMVEVPAKVIASGVHSSRGSGKNSTTTYKAKVAFQYHFDGRDWHSGWLNFDRGTTSSGNYDKARDAANRYPVGSTPRAWVDPQAPWQAVLEKDGGGTWWLWIFPIVFGGIGLIGLGVWLLKLTALGAALLGTKRSA